jgi:hypothetical protein
MNRIAIDITNAITLTNLYHMPSGQLLSPKNICQEITMIQNAPVKQLRVEDVPPQWMPPRWGGGGERNISVWYIGKHLEDMKASHSRRQ